MDTKNLKLRLLKKVIDTDDPKVLRTIGDILDIHSQAFEGEEESQASGYSFPPEPLAHAKNASQANKDIEDLQRSIDDVFDGEGEQDFSDEEW